MRVLRWWKLRRRERGGENEVACVHAMYAHTTVHCFLESYYLCYFGLVASFEKWKLWRWGLGALDGRT